MRREAPAGAPMPRDNRYDQAGRYLARGLPLQLVGWLLGLPPTAYSAHGWVDTRNVPFPGDPERICDTVLFLRDQARGGVPWAVLLEFQAEADPVMFGRLLQYLGGLWVAGKPGPHTGDRFHLGAVVVNLTGRGTCPPPMEWPEAGLMMHLGVVECDLATFDAVPLMARVEAGEVGRVALPLVPLMKNAGDPAMIQ